MNLALNRIPSDSWGRDIVCLYCSIKCTVAASTHGKVRATAAHYFVKLSEIAVPGPFFFCGDVPDELKQAVEAMYMGAVFGVRASGFTRNAPQRS